LLLGIGLALAATACGPVEIDTYDLEAADRAACEAFAADLPDTLADEDSREIEPADALGAAYGDPAITITCGVPVPASFDQTSSCDETNGVGWYVPVEQINDPDRDVTLTAVGYHPIIEIVVPSGDDRGNNAAAAMAELAQPIKTHLELINACN